MAAGLVLAHQQQYPVLVDQAVGHPILQEAHKQVVQVQPDKATLEAVLLVGQQLHIIHQGAVAALGRLELLLLTVAPFQMAVLVLQVALLEHLFITQVAVVEQQFLRATLQGQAATAVVVLVVTVLQMVQMVRQIPAAAVVVQIALPERYTHQEAVVLA